MATTQAMSKQLIEAGLRATGFRWLMDSDGDYTIRFGAESERNVDLNIWILTAGSQSQVLVLRCWTNRRFGRNEWGRVIYACNEWNRDKRWPKAVLPVDDSDDGEGVGLSLEQDFDLEAGASVEQMNTWISAFAAGSHAFWVWALNERRL